jgi:LysM repeat protein
MKVLTRVLMNYLNKPFRVTVFVFCFAFIHQGYGQALVISKNITTISGKKYYLHKVANGQSLYGIAKLYKIDVNTILVSNPNAIDGIKPGQELKIPVDNSPAIGASPAAVQETKAPEPATPVETPTVQPQSTTTVNSGSGEPDLLALADDGPKEKEYVTSTFKSTRNINFHTAEVLGKRCLDFRISHRFGPLNSGANNAWGVDGPANLMLSLEYSHNGRWMVGISRSTYAKMAEGFFKWKMIRQVKHGFPFTITYFGAVYESFQQNSTLSTPTDFYSNTGDRVSYVNQLIIASKITPWLSLQVAPAYVHYNLVGSAIGLYKNDCFALLGVIRAKYNKRQAIIFEYGWRLNTNYGSAGTKYYNSLGIGWEVETGGHVFQIFATNSYGIMENQYIMTTNTSWSGMGVRIGFNITRIFALSKKSE